MRIPTLLAFAVALAVAGCGSTPKDVPPPDAGPAELLAHGRSLAEAGEFEDARDAFESIVDNAPTAPESADAMWLVAEMSQRLGKFARASKEYQAYHERYPLGRLGELEEAMYTEVARNLWFAGERGALGLGIFTNTTTALDALRFVADELSSGSRADDALLFLGKVRLQADDSAAAVDHFSLLIERYPESEWVFEAQFYRAWAHWLANRGAPYDLAGLLKARAGFQRYIKIVEADPQRRNDPLYSRRLAESRENLTEIEGVLAEKNLYIARYYLSLERQEAARPYLLATTRDFPGTEAAEQARRLIGSEK